MKDLNSAEIVSQKGMNGVLLYFLPGVLVYTRQIYTSSSLPQFLHFP